MFDGLMSNVFNCLISMSSTHFFVRLPNFSLCNILNFSGFEPKIILTIFLSVKGVTLLGSGRNIFKSLFMSYFIIKQIRRGTE